MNDAEEIRERGEALRRLAQSLEGKPVVWGPDGDDCSQLPLQWVVSWRERMTGVCPDVDAPDYSTEEESLALIAKAGGLVNLWDPICQQLGMDPLGPTLHVVNIGPPDMGETMTPIAASQVYVGPEIGGLPAGAWLFGLDTIAASLVDKARVTPGAPMGTPSGEPILAVGGFAEMVTIDRAGITRQVVREWPEDKVGHKINPTAS